MQFLKVDVARSVHNKEEIYDGPNAQAAAGEEFGHAEACLAQVEAVDAQSAAKNREDKGSERAFELQTAERHPLAIIGFQQGLAQELYLLFGKFLGVGDDIHIDFLLVHSGKVFSC